MMNTYPARKVVIVHVHLAHMMNRQCAVHGSSEPKLADSIRKCSQVQSVRVRQQHSINSWSNTATKTSPRNRKKKDSLKRTKRQDIHRCCQCNCSPMLELQQAFQYFPDSRILISKSLKVVFVTGTFWRVGFASAFWSFEEFSKRVNNCRKEPCKRLEEREVESVCPATIQKESKIVHLQQVAQRRLRVRPTQGRHPHIGSHLPFPSLSLTLSPRSCLRKKMTQTVEKEASPVSPKP